MSSLFVRQCRNFSSREIFLGCVSWIGFVLPSLAQSFDYRSADNPHYWAHRPPVPGYWQQDVHYRLEAYVDDERDRIEGRAFALTYWNNAPDTLRHLFFHLYQNAFQPGSYYHNLWLENTGQEPRFGRYEAQGLGTTTEDIRVNGQPVATELDNTILRLTLNQPLPPGDSLTVTMRFTTYFDRGEMRRRMKLFEAYGYKHYDGVHWYPSLAVYDRKFGWTTEQHLDKEFYGDFGTFEVALTFPQEYVVEATGVLQNATEVLPDTLRAQLDLFNFRDKPFGSAPSVITPRVPGQTKTWRFRAVNVHNFAFTADPLYRIGEVRYGDVRCLALVQEPHAAGWLPSARFTADLIRVYSEDFGDYIWPKIIVADARDGMEYPMLTLDGGTYPGHRGLLAHEVGHMWFYGMLGSNEQYRALMDEGFTQFLTVWALDRLVGARLQRVARHDYLTQHLDPLDQRYQNLYFPYLRTVWRGFDHALNTHSSDFRGALRQGGGYGLVYFKTGTMLYQLRYVLGDALFRRAMQHYVAQWKLAHPYPEDFRTSIIQFTGVDLNWFFDQWLETTKTLDYGVDRIRRVKEDGGTDYTYDVQFSRRGQMQMPFDFTIETTDGQTLRYHVPNTWFVKETAATVLPRWYGWGDKLQPTYTARVQVPGRIAYVTLDPEEEMADLNRVNNRLMPNWTLELDHRVPNLPHWSAMRNFWRPDVWYHALDGLQLGLHAEGDYFGQTYQYSATAWWNSRLLQRANEAFADEAQPVAGRLWARQQLRRAGRQVFAEQYLVWNAGLWKGGLTLEKTFRQQDDQNPRYTVGRVTADFQQRYRSADLAYLIYPDFWSVRQLNSTFLTEVARHYPAGRGQGVATLGLRTPGFFSDFNFSYAELTLRHAHPLGKARLQSRLYGRVGAGQVPPESQLYVAGASPEELYENKFTWARGWVPAAWEGYGPGLNHFQQGGGLNLRGYAGWLIPNAQADGLEPGLLGRSGAAANLELDVADYLPRLLPALRPYLHLDAYLFADAGVITNADARGRDRLAPLRADAGLGTALHIKFTPLDIAPLVLRFDAPLYVRDPPPGDPSLQFRYVVGVGRSF